MLLLDLEAVIRDGVGSVTGKPYSFIPCGHVDSEYSVVKDSKMKAGWLSMLRIEIYGKYQKYQQHWSNLSCSTHSAE